VTAPQYISLLLALNAFGCTAAVEEEPTPGAEIQGVYRSPIESVPCPDEDDDGASVRLTIARVRALAGLSGLRCDSAASRAARGHCDYVVANGELTHVQQRGRKAFTGETFADRLHSAGFAEDPGGEVLANFSGGGAILGADGFLNSVYHRALFLRSEMTSFGYGHSAACATLDFGRDTKASAITVVWPPPGSFDVPRTFNAARETPNPMPGLSAVGAPISLVRPQALPRFDASLTGPKGNVEARLITHANDPHKFVRVGEAHLVPLSPLEPRTTYRARFGDIAETTFTTGD
jgi:uncharacterized protein YkwD